MTLIFWIFMIILWADDTCRYMLYKKLYDRLHFNQDTYIHQYRQYSIWIIAYKSNQDNEVLLNSIWQEIVIIVNKATTSLDRKHYLCFTWGKQSFSFFQIEAVMSAYDFHMQSGELYCSFLKTDVHCSWKLFASFVVYSHD